MTIPVVIADDQPVVAAGVETVLKKHSYRVVACVNDTDTLVETLADVDVEVVVADPNMPVGRHPDGVSLVRRIRTIRPDVGIVVMSRLDNVANLRLMLDLGVAALLDKRTALRGIPAAVHAASIGRRFLSPAVRRAFREVDEANARRDAHERLTQREIAVLRAYARGLSLAEVARLMTRSIKTISRQKRSAMLKLGLRNDAQLYQYLVNVRSGLVESFLLGEEHEAVLAAACDPWADEDEAYVETRQQTAAVQEDAAVPEGAAANDEA
ncbi:response regulator [Luteibacter sp.]|uniref:response regulator n=1 Tax=Luteibacter sp. TaxID=1886636 RepID=UPI003F7F325F